MRYPVSWMPQAELSFAMVIEYLEERWTSKELKAFIDRTDEVIGFIALRPKQYSYS